MIRSILDFVICEASLGVIQERELTRAAQPLMEPSGSTSALALSHIPAPRALLSEVNG